MKLTGNDVPVGTRSPSAGGGVNPTVLARADLRVGGYWGREDCILALSFSEGLPPSPGRQHSSKDPQIPSSFRDNNMAEDRK